MDVSIETLASGAIAAGCLQAVMSMVHPELVKFVAFQKERVARSDAERSVKRKTNTLDLANLSLLHQTDLSFQLKYLCQHWHSHLKFFELDPELPGVVQRALLYRNKVAHQSHMSLAQYEAAIATFEKLADIIECNLTIRQQIKELGTKLLSFSPLRKAEVQTVTKQVRFEIKDQVLSQASIVMPPTASLDQILQHDHFCKGKENVLWVDLKLIGNDYFNEGNYTEAIEAYSQGLEVAPNEAVLYGNRATSYLKSKMFEHAREDAQNALDADDYENVKYYRLLSETLLAMEDYDEAKDICDQGLEVEPDDLVLCRRRRTLEAKIEEKKVACEKEKKRLELKVKAKVVAAANAATRLKQEEYASGKNKVNKERNSVKSSATKIELVAMINYQEVPAKWIEIHTFDSRQFKEYQQGMESLIVAAKALLQIMDSIGIPGRSKLPLNQLVEEGIVNLRKAGEAGVAEAWFRLGVLYSSSVRKGLPLTADPLKMLECFQRAASLRPFIKPPGHRVFSHQGVAEAENELGVCYRDGIPATDVKADQKKAFQFFLRSAEHDYPVGQYHVAIAYSTGKGTPVDVLAARMWTSRAAQHGLPEAQQYLAQLLQQGYGGNRDESQARKWALKAEQNRLTDLLLSRDCADVCDTAFKDERAADKFASNLSVSQRSKCVSQQFYDAYLKENSDEKSAPFDVDDGKKLQGAVGRSCPASITTSSNHVSISGICRPASAVIDAEIQVRAKNGGITACKYLASEKLLQSASKLLEIGDSKGALEDLKQADLLWEQPKSATIMTQLLSKVLKEAAMGLQIHPEDINAAYAMGRWGTQIDRTTVSHWKRCVKLHPNEAYFYFYLGTAYLALRRFDDAMDAMKTALAIDKKPDWLFWLAAPMIGLGMLDPALSVYKEYVETNAPDERFMPDAYYLIGALYLKKHDNTMATVYHELGQMAESVTIRFPAFYPRVLHESPKETLRSGMKKSGYMESPVIENVMAQNMLECGFCKITIKPTQLLSHKLIKCPRRMVSCQNCNEQIVFDNLQAHRQAQHAGFSCSKRKRRKLKKRHQSAIAPLIETVERAIYKQCGVLQELTAPKFHFLGTIFEIKKDENKHTVFTLQTIMGQRWSLRMGQCSYMTDVFHASRAIKGAEVNNSLVVFWCNSPPSESIGGRTLVVPMKREVYGQDVVVYILNCSAQALNFELCQMRYNKYMESATFCAGCSNSPYLNERLLTCGVCKVVKYCTRDCQRLHWKRIHRHMCKHASLLRFCSGMSDDVASDERASSEYQSQVRKNMRLSALKSMGS